MTLLPKFAVPEFATRRPRIVLVLYCLAVWLPGFFSLPPTDRDESRFAQATKQMVETGDFVEIRNGREARNRKPIGIYWLQVPGAALARAAGVAIANPIWPYRLPSLAGGLIAVLATFAIARRVAGVQAGMLAGAMLGCSVLLTVETRIAKTDAALLAVTTLAMGALLRVYLGETRRRDAILFWLMLGAGILIKGPITPMIAGSTALVLVIADRRARWLAALRPLWGVPLMLAVVLPWFVAIGIATHGEFFADAVGGDLTNKLTGGDDAHGAPPGYHLLLLSLTMFPSAAIALGALPSAWRGRREPATRFLLAWLVPVWLIFEAVPTKLPHYTLPLFPALCVLAAGWIASPSRHPAPRWLAATARVLTLAAAAILTLGGAALPVLLAGGATRLAVVGVPTLVTGSVLFVLLWHARTPMKTLRAGLLAAPLLYWSLLYVELPRAAPLWISPRACAAVAQEPHAGGFGAVGYAEPSLMFLCGTDTLMFPGPGMGASFLAEGADRLLLVERRDAMGFADVTEQLGVGLVPLAEIDGLDYSNGHREELTLYRRK